MDTFNTAENEIGERLDKVLANRFPQFSRVIWQKQINEGTVLVNGLKPEPKTKLLLGSQVSLTIPKDEAMPLPPSTLALEVIFENQDALVINKPAGLITHPAHAHTLDSVAQRLTHHYPQIKQAVYDPTQQISLWRPGIVHRLDKDTSGVLLIAKTKEAMHFLAKQIQSHRVKKIYQALLWGWLDEPTLTVHNYLGRDVHDRRKMAVVSSEKGREAITDITLISRLKSSKDEKASLIEAQPITGRTHQIRVHATSIHHPVLGDPLYHTKESADLSARLGLNRQFLHAYQLTVRLPGESSPRIFTAPLPEDLQKILDNFKEEKI